MTAQLILALSIMVTIHELGHFWAARAFGIKVEKFYLFFDAWNVRLWRTKRNNTEFGIGWLPFGGYVKIAGMVDESMDKEQMNQPARPDEFRSKPAWQRLVVMVSGVVMNTLLGIAIFSCLLMFVKKEYLPNSSVTKGIIAYPLGQKTGFKTGDKIAAINGEPIDRFDDIYSTDVVAFGAKITVNRNGRDTVIKVPSNFYKSFGSHGRLDFITAGPVVCSIRQVVPGENADKAGLREKDKIIAINNVSITSDEDVIKQLRAHKKQPVKFTIKRNGQLMNIMVSTNDSGRVGILPATIADIDPSYKMMPYTFGKAIRYGISDAFEAITSTAKGLGKIFKGEENASDSLQGPIGIATLFGPQWDWMRFWTLTGLLSMVLAFMNILPIPALDGGHAVFIISEMISGRKPSDKFLEHAQMAGMFILLCLMVFAFGNDLWRIFKK